MASNDMQVITAQQRDLAKNDTVTNVHGIESKLSNYGGKAIPVTVTFHQSFETPTFETVVIKMDEVKMEDVKNDKGEIELLKNGKPKRKPVMVEGGKKKDRNGKEHVYYIPATTGKQIDKRFRFETGKRKDERVHNISFLCFDASDLRHKIGEAFNEIKGRFEMFKRNELLHVTFNFGGKVLSTKYLSLGGVKLSKVYAKGKFQNDLYAENFCRPLFQQLQSVEKGENNKPLEIDETILAAIGLKKEDKKSK